jgi:hypothetical protein
MVFVSLPSQFSSNEETDLQNLLHFLQSLCLCLSLSVKQILTISADGITFLEAPEVEEM